MYNVSISEESYDEVFRSFRKQKLIVGRPESISVTEENGIFKVSLTISPGTYRKASTYTTYKPLFKFIKDQISEQTGLQKVQIHWEISRLCH
jgi:hypothetical protein